MLINHLIGGIRRVRRKMGHQSLEVTGQVNNSQYIRCAEHIHEHILLTGISQTIGKSGDDAVEEFVIIGDRQ
jgi:hypothetical protein